MSLLQSFLTVSLIFFLTSHDSLKVQQEPGKSTYSNSIVIDGTQLNYVIEGKGKPCLVIGSSVYYPRTFSNELRNHFQFYFVDMRWFAKSYSPVRLEDFTLQTIVNDIDKIITELKLEKVIIMGHSIHGTIAFEYARKHPDKVSHIVMIGSPNYQSNQEQENAINKLWNTASDERKEIQSKNWKILAGMNNLSPAQSEIETYCLMSPKYWFDPRYDAHWLWADMTLNTDILHHLYNKIFLNYHMFKDSRKVPAPTFIALGRFDYIDPASLWNEDNNISGLTIKIFERSGHTPQLEESELFDKELVEWINTSY
jgi:proline iminopeptidase